MRFGADAIRNRWFVIIDGNHRVAALKSLMGTQYEVKTIDRVAILDSAVSVYIQGDFVNIF